jgi:hypothetical protein
MASDLQVLPLPRPRSDFIFTFRPGCCLLPCSGKGKSNSLPIPSFSGFAVIAFCKGFYIIFFRKDWLGPPAGQRM